MHVASSLLHVSLRRLPHNGRLARRKFCRRKLPIPGQVWFVQLYRISGKDTRDIIGKISIVFIRGAHKDVRMSLASFFSSNIFRIRVVWRQIADKGIYNFLSHRLYL